MKDLPELYEFWIRNNVSFLVRYCSTVSTALEGVKENPHGYREFQVNGTDLKYVEAIISSHKEHLSYSAILLTYATLEEFLTFLIRDLGRLLNIPIGPFNNRGMKGYRLYVQKTCSIDKSKLDVDWNFLEDFAVVRHSIIHANGNKMLLNKPKKLESVVSKYPRELSFKDTAKLIVENCLIERCIGKTFESAAMVNNYMSKK